MNEDGSMSECVLKGFECFLCGWCPGQRSGLFRKRLVRRGLVMVLYF